MGTDMAQSPDSLIGKEQQKAALAYCIAGTHHQT
jgi:hypothetical protein